MQKEINLVLNGIHSVEQAKRTLDKWYKERTEQSGEVFHFFLKPFKAPKTYKQLKSIHELCNQLSNTDINEHAGHSSEHWRRYYKLRAYVPQLKSEALEKGDTDLVDLIQSASDLIKASRGQALFKYDLEKILTAYNAFLIKNNSKKRSLEDMAKGFIAAVKKRELGKDSEYSVSDMIADNPAFSYANASKEQLIKVIDCMLNDAAKKGIYLELKNEPTKESEK